MDNPSSSVPRWTPKSGPASSPVQEPVIINAGVADFETQSVASEGGDHSLLNSIPLQQNSSDYVSDNVPRWTPKASPTSAGDVGDLETQSVASEDEVPLANSLPQQEESTESAPDHDVPRWTPKASPEVSGFERPLASAGVGDLETQSVASEDEVPLASSRPHQEESTVDYAPDHTVPRWTPKASPERSPFQQPLASAGVGGLETQSVASEDEVSFSNSLPRQEESPVDYAPDHTVPRWTPKASPARSSFERPLTSAGVGDLETQSVVSEDEVPFANSLPRQEETTVNYAPDHTVPRWTPKASPARSPFQKPLANEGVGDLETQSVASEDEVSFANSLPRQENSMDCAPNVPRWTPKASPTRSPVKEAVAMDIPARVGSYDMGSIASEDDSRSFSSTKFPYSIAGFTPGASHLDIHNPSSRRFESQVANSLRIEQENHAAGNNHVGPVSRKKEGVFLTWKDLWVTVPDGKRGRRSILQGLTGYAEPGGVLAIMGPSGCGKSTLLDSLAGRLSSNAQQTGEILINGRKETLAFGTSAYVTQDDTLMTTLTVREAVYYSAQLQLPDSMSNSEKKERAEMTIREMGLQDSLDTRIGGWNVKGLSGGQKRRVSICIEILTRPKLLFLDEPTSGLDSAASFHVMSRIVKIAHQDGRTVIASIHQPSSEVFELFDNLCLLSTGRTVYFGPASMSEKFFASNGFPCPSLRNPSDHYLRTINKDFDADIEQGSHGTVSTEEVITMLVKSYKSSETFQDVQQSVSQICQQKGGALEKGSHANFITQCLVLTKRSFVNMYRDLGYYWLRLAVYIALCLCVGTIFYDIGSSYGSIQARGSMLMFVAAFLTFMAIGGFPSFVEDMKIFGRERLNGHYGVGAYVFGNSFSSIPYLLLISIVPGAIAYYLVGLQRSFEHFAYFVSVLFVCMMLVESLMMIVASIVPDFLMGIITGAGIQGVMMLNGGFFRLPNDLPKPFWRYPMYYIAFHKYANQGFFKNEFKGLTFPNEQAGGSLTITGDEILRNTWQVEMGYSKWIDLAILFGMVILYRVMFWGIIKASEKVKPMIKALISGSPKQSERIVDEPSATAS